ncbi:DUF2375 family protein [Thalassotalea euphylliae]|uniref:DUF2375 domain-containing protein n=1 Tax=Thalassotalea euphylliae TaxID=1655234 RepID=A0A3E0TYM8_9GAMM|nr:DUF2375 family protein [Thalassotalea euphylliae]REL29756.1 DUF2375 domain-containing protein [Thalassotalea euphylliae]REL35333.1 DUF2375 domain-containing protein [Thalassotalea euphylliae]
MTDSVSDNKQLVTVLYLDNNDVQLKHHYGRYPRRDNGRVVLPNDFKQNKQILAVCKGMVTVLSGLGDRIGSENFTANDSSTIHEMTASH